MEVWRGMTPKCSQLTSWLAGIAFPFPKYTTNYHIYMNMTDKNQDSPVGSLAALGCMLVASMVVRIAPLA